MSLGSGRAPGGPASFLTIGLSRPEPAQVREGSASEGPTVVGTAGGGNWRAVGKGHLRVCQGCGRQGARLPKFPRSHGGPSPAPTWRPSGSLHRGGLSGRRQGKNRDLPGGLCPNITVLRCLYSASLTSTIFTGSRLSSSMLQGHFTALQCSHHNMQLVDIFVHMSLCLFLLFFKNN